jgi:hypothetical protein
MPDIVCYLFGFSRIDKDVCNELHPSARHDLHEWNNGPNIDVCLESVSKLNYDVFNTTIPRGRICIHGSSLFSIYYNTKKVPIVVKTCIRSQKGCRMLKIINQNQTFIFLLPFKNIITMAS